VCAGGNNDSGTVYSEIQYPAFYSECLSVGSLQQGNIISPTTIISNKLKLVAPGINIYSTSLYKGYKVLSGSSQATPFVAGIAAIAIQYLKSKGKQYTSKGILQLLVDSADPIDGVQCKIVNPTNIINSINNGKETYI